MCDDGWSLLSDAGNSHLRASKHLFVLKGVFKDWFCWLIVYTMSAIGDNVAGEATVTRSGRVVKLTEKAQEMQAAKPKQSSRAPV